MPVDSRELFQFMREAYKAGLLKKWFEIMEESQRQVFEELGITGYELMDSMDRGDPSEMEAGLERIAPWLKWIARPFVMKSLSGLLDVPLVRRKLIEKFRADNRKRFAGPALKQ